LVIHVNAINNFEGQDFTETLVNLVIKNAPPNTTITVTVNVVFSVRVNPFYEVTMPVLVSVTTDNYGEGVGHVVKSIDCVNTFAREYLGEGYETAMATESIGIESVKPSWNIRGDIDGDGRVTSADATLLAQWLVDNTSRDICVVAASLTGNEKPSVADLLYLARWLVGLEGNANGER